MDTNTLINKLKELNYFKYIPESEMELALEKAKESLEEEVLSIDFDLYDETGVLASRDRRSFGIDGEDLAEGGIEEQLKDIEKILDSEDFVIDEISQEGGTGDGYKVTVNGKEYRVYEESEITSDDLWTLALIGLMKISNDIFAESGSTAKLYATHGGNDGAVYILTPEQYDLMIQNGINTQDSSVKPNDIEAISDSL